MGAVEKELVYQPLVSSGICVALPTPLVTMTSLASWLISTALMDVVPPNEAHLTVILSPVPLEEGAAETKNAASFAFSPIASPP